MKTYTDWGIILRHLLGQATEEENREVERWLNEDEQNRVYYRKAGRYFDTYYSGDEIREIDTKAAWTEFVAYTEKFSVRILWSKVRFYAALAILVIGMGMAYRMHKRSSGLREFVADVVPIEPGKTKAVLVFHSGDLIELGETSVFEDIVREHAKGEAGGGCNRVVVPRGGEYGLVLEDGTTVKLNADSELEFPETFGAGERRVHLRGEAMFKVAENAVRPFVVETEGGEVRVLGTEFNLNAYPEDECVQTTLVRGKVAFKGEGIPAAVVISPGEQLVYNKKAGEVSVSKVDTHIYTAWTEGKWIIEGERLENIMTQLSRWYGVTVSYREQELKDLIFTGDLERYENCEVVLNMISMTTKVVFEIKDKSVIVKKR